MRASLDLGTEGRTSEPKPLVVVVVAVVMDDEDEEKRHSGSVNFKIARE